MQNFEISHSLTDITQIWEAFFYPVVSTVIVFAFLYVLMGREYLSKVYHDHKLIKVDDRYYRQKHIKIKKGNTRGNVAKKTIFVPVSGMEDKFVAIFQNPIFFIIGLLLLVYTVYKIINLCSSMYPLTYGFNGEALLLYSVSSESIAKVWVYFPDYSLELLYRKISTLGMECPYAKYADYSAIHMFCKLSEFCSVLCIVKLFLVKPKIKELFKTGLLFLFCLCMVIFSYFLQFQKDAKVLQQKTYYVREQVELDDPLISFDIDRYVLASQKVENELRYVKHKAFYGAFILDFEWKLR